MLEASAHTAAVQAVFVLALLSFLGVVFISAPYGRHERAGWGPTLSSRTAWVVMESPAVILFAAFYLLGSNRFEVPSLVLCALWMLHYVYRAFIFPFRMRISTKKVPLLIPLLAIGFNTINAYINAMWIGEHGAYALSWLYDPRFIAGSLLFLGGRHVNLQSDGILIRLRKPGESGYKIPYGGYYRWVSAPNYLGEILQWFGWALLTWSTAGLAFAVYTVANLAPRAHSHHAWYHSKFKDYPDDRKVLIPFIW
jgi:protein-S-isoprenylcysteine O-methyltransferase Ste14